jgi:alpha-tubulin suppressor-like RCC1 family protein
MGGAGGSPGPLTVKSIDAGGTHTCAALSDGRARCWGNNASGEIGNGKTGMDEPKPVNVASLTDATAVAAGGISVEQFSCALRSGKVSCWGTNTYGQLGSGNTTPVAQPVEVKDLTTASSMSLGLRHACARLSNSTLRCWGDNKTGQLGVGMGVTFNHTPVDVGLTDVKAVSAGSHHTCALMDNGDVLCWGEGKSGELGNGQMSVQYKPDKSKKVNLIPKATAVAAGTNFTCALGDDKSVWCWGSNSSYQLGTAMSLMGPRQITITGASSIGVGASHACAVLQSGSVYCWGDNASQQLGVAGGNSAAAVHAGKLDGATAVDGGLAHTCAQLAAGSAKCWGGNSSGQLGHGTVGMNHGFPGTPTDLLAP